MYHAELCEMLAWDSEFFRRRIARATTHCLRSDTVEDIVAWCSQNSVECLYFLAEVDDPGTIRLAEDHGFRQVDIRVTLERRLDRVPAPQEGSRGGVIRPSAPGDVPALRALARISHHDSRFYYDPNFPEARCDDLYATWIERSCEGYADAVLVADEAGSVAGYVSCHLAEAGGGSIGLFAVSPAYHGVGVGRALLSESLRWFAARGVGRVTVVTQGRNCRAQRLYQRGGFVSRSLLLWYHRWFV